MHGVSPKIAALLSLLDDEDENVAVNAMAELLFCEEELGEALAGLQESPDALTRKRAHQLQAAITLRRRRRHFSELLKAPKVYDLPYIDDSDEQGRVRTALYWERGFELAFEGQRKYDLIRWGVLDKALQLFGSNSVVNQNGRNAYLANQNFQTGKHELLPIPLSEIQSNPLLEGKNNPGY